MKKTALLFLLTASAAFGNGVRHLLAENDASNTPARHDDSTADVVVAAAAAADAAAVAAGVQKDPHGRTLKGGKTRIAVCLPNKQGVYSLIMIPEKLLERFQSQGAIRPFVDSLPGEPGVFLDEECNVIKPRCFNNNDGDMKEQCASAGANCCANNCFLPPGSTVCEGSCNGVASCVCGSPWCTSPLYVNPNSCNGYYTCTDITGTVGTGSCNNSLACYRIQQSVAIGDNSCNGCRSCSKISVDVGSDSCNDVGSCYSYTFENILNGTCNESCETSACFGHEGCEDCDCGFTISACG